MIPSLIARLARTSGAELAWRARTARRGALQRVACAWQPSRWRREDLRKLLASSAELADVLRALDARSWDDAHDLLQNHFATRPLRFVLGPADRALYANAILERYPGAAATAKARADRIADGEHDLLGYEGVRFAGDWHLDPVSGRRAPLRFWSAVPFLDPAFGDHKVIWEVNRHQHWLAFGRACWLTGDGKYRRAWLSELHGWLDANPPLMGINWASMLELSFRSISWIWALHFFARTDAGRGEGPWTIDLLLGLDRQLAHVEENLSYYFSPNTHLLGEALALYVAGRALPELTASERRAAIGRRLLVAEAARQVPPDGFHCERSTHYHRYTLDFYLLALAVARITGDPVAAGFERTVDRLATAARMIADDTGRAPHLGDDDGGMLLPIAGRAPDDWRDSLATAAVLIGRDDLRIGEVPEETIWMAGRRALDSTSASGAARTPATARAEPRPGQRSCALPDAGYYVSRSGNGEHVVFDGGAHGYLNGGHAHADALSMTLSLRGLPFLIDPGTACYTMDGALRDRFRTTAAHNTLLLDDAPASKPAGPFHWSRTADARTTRWRTTEGFDYVDAWHAGYAPLVHRRSVLVLGGDLIVVVDAVEGAGRHKAALHWHVGGEWSATARSRSVAFAAGTERVGLFAPEGRIDLLRGDEETGLGWHSPAYGRVEPAATVRIVHEGQAPFALVTVFDLNPSDPVTAVDWLPVWAEAGALARSAAVRIGRSGSTDYAAVAESASDAARPAWRVGEFETDAHALCLRTGRTGEVARVAMVDGSFVRGTGRRAIGVALGRVLPSVFINESTIRNFTPCAASPVS